MSSDDGNYRFDAVLAGRWRAVAAASGCEPSMSEPFEVRAGERATIPNIRLYPTIPVTLRARSAAGRTTGAWVRIFRTDGDPEPGPPQRVHVEAGGAVAAHAAAGHGVRVTVEPDDGSSFEPIIVKIPDRWDSTDGDFAIQIDLP